MRCGHLHTDRRLHPAFRQALVTSPGRVTSQGPSQLETVRSKEPSNPPRRTTWAAKLILAIELLRCSKASVLDSSFRRPRRTEASRYSYRNRPGCRVYL